MTEIIGSGLAFPLQVDRRGGIALARDETDIEQAIELRDTDDWKQVLDELNEDHPRTPEAMRLGYEEWTETARAYLREHRLVSFPDGEECAVVPSPHFQRPVLAVASYMQPPPFSDRMLGHFFVPYPPEGASEEETDAFISSLLLEEAFGYDEEVDSFDASFVEEALGWLPDADPSVEETAGSIPEPDGSGRAYRCAGCGGLRNGGAAAATCAPEGSDGRPGRRPESGPGPRPTSARRGSASARRRRPRPCLPFCPGRHFS